MPSTRIDVSRPDLTLQLEEALKNPDRYEDGEIERALEVYDRRDYNTPAIDRLVDQWRSSERKKDAARIAEERADTDEQERQQDAIDAAAERAKANPLDPGGKLQAERNAYEESLQYGPPDKLTSFDQVPDGMVQDLRDRGFPVSVAMQIAMQPPLWEMVQNGETLEDVQSDLKQAGVEVPSWEEVQAEAKRFQEDKAERERKTAQWKADQAAAQPDYIDERIGRYEDETADKDAERRANVDALGSTYGQLGDQYGDSVTGSEGYKGVGEFSDEMRGIYDQGGLTDVTRAGLEQNRRDEDQWIRAQREAMLQDLAERGTAGGGAEIAGAIGDRAAAADRMSARDLDTRAFAQEQALKALTASKDADKDIFGWDRDIATTKLGLGKDAADQKLSLEEELARAWMKNTQRVLEDVDVATDENWDAQRDDVVPAAKDAIDVLGGSSKEGRDDVTEVFGEDVPKLDATGAELSGGTGTINPNEGTTTPFENPADLRPGEVEGGADAMASGGDLTVGLLERSGVLGGGGGDKDEEEK